MAWAKLGGRVREERKRREWSVKEMAKITGLSVSTIKRIEAGSDNTTLETLDKVCNVFSISMEELFSGVDSKELSSELEKRLKALNSLPKSKQSIAIEMLDSLIFKSQSDELRTV